MQPPTQSADRKCIFLVEDSYKDLLLMRYVMEETGMVGCIFAARTGKEAAGYLRNKARQQEFGTPGVVILDINLPEINGLKLLQLIRSDPTLKHLPVVIFTDSQDANEHNRAYVLGATALKVKPTEFSEFSRVFRELLEYWCKELSLKPERRADAPEIAPFKPAS